MEDLPFLEQIRHMPADAQQDIRDYVNYVWEKKLGRQPYDPKKRLSGVFKGKIWMSADFDEPLEDLKDYM